jgi:hypothetical protein
MFTTEELRVAALEASAKRGKWVAKRRIMWRWFAWANWNYALPSIGLLTVLVATTCFIFWQFLGPEQVYKTAQTWMQSQLSIADENPHPAAPMTSTTSTGYSLIEPADSSMILKTTLRLSRQLSLPKTEPESTKP